jgi:photosystem II stability/assembly factor-like uncharacterized protein
MMTRRACSLIAVALFFLSPLLLDLSPESGPGREPSLAPNMWFWNQRAYPHGDIKQESYKLAIDQALAKKAEARRLRDGSTKNLLLAVEWEERGPVNFGGRVTDLAVHPTDASTAYAAMASGGVFKTINGGIDWVPCFDDQAVLSCGAVAVDPGQPETVWVGTGEANAGSYSFFGLGIYRSDDGGSTWQNKGLAEGRYIARIAVDPTDGDRVFAAVTGKLFGTGPNRGVFRTLDGGDSWERCFALTDSTAAIDLAMHPQNPNLIYAAMWERVRGLTYRRSGGPSSGIWRTTDGGDTWQHLTSGLPGGSNGRIGISLCTSQPDILYAVYADDIGYLSGVYKTTNGGDTWTYAGSSSLANVFSSYGWWFGNIRVDPVNPDNAFVLGLPLYRTTNGGASWSEVGSNMHVDHHAMAFAPSQPNKVYEGNDGGLYLSTDSGGNWTVVDNQPTIQFYAITIDEQHPERLYGGTQDNGTWRTLTGNIDDWEHILGGDGFHCLVDPTDSDIIFAEYQYGGLNKSTNGGAWFTGAMEGVSGSDRINWSMPVIMTPGNPNTMYLGTHRVYMSIDQGDYWSPISDDLTGGDQGGGFGTITTLACAPSAPGKVMAGTDDGRVWVYVPLFGNWSLVSSGLPNRWITRVAFDPVDSSILYVTLSGLRWEEKEGHVFKSTDGGSTWTDISGDLPEAPVNCLVVDPDLTDWVYVGTDVGCYVTQNEGASWQVLGEGLPNAPVLDLKFHQGTRTLVAGTHGRSMFSLILPLASGTDDTPALARSLDLSCHPNPFNPMTTLRFRLASDGFVSLEIFSPRGERVARPLQGRLEAGNHEIRWDGRDSAGRTLPSGVYLARITTGDQSSTTKLVLAR